jgi:hypothetical protein
MAQRVQAGEIELLAICRQAFKRISGPMPAGSPMVKPMRIARLTMMSP